MAVICDAKFNLYGENPMATATTLTAWDNALKQYYRGAEVEKLVYDSHPFMELVPKSLGL